MIVYPSIVFSSFVLGTGSDSFIYTAVTALIKGLGEEIKGRSLVEMDEL